VSEAEAPARPPLPWRRVLLVSLWFGLLAGAFMILRVFGYGEIWLSRTQWLTGMAIFGGFVGAFITLLILRWLGPRLSRLLQGMGAALSFGGFYLAGFGMAFVFHNRVIAGQYEPHPDHPMLSIVFSSLQTAGLFAFSIPRYALWWMLPALMLAAAIILPRIMRLRG
jgi:hypothetical protein